MIHPNTRRQVVVKSQDEPWDESTIMELLSENFEDANEVRDSIADVAKLIFSYARSSHSPYHSIQDISAFKSDAEWSPDYMAEGEQYIQSLLEFNQNVHADSLANGEIVDEVRAKEALEATSLVSCPPVVETVLTYCFRHYKMKEHERTKLTVDPLSVSEKVKITTG